MSAESQNKNDRKPDQMSRGDLGFLQNSLRQLPSRNFLGATSNPSKKGVAIASAVRMPTVVTDGGTDKMGGGVVLTSEALEEKRTDFLEKQEKKLRTAVNETRSFHTKIEEQMESCNKVLGQTIQSSNEYRDAQTEMMENIFAWQQWVYARARDDLFHLGTPEDLSTSMTRDDFNTRKQKLASKGDWVLLVYPMKEIELEDGQQITSMRAKVVDQDTGQISILMAVLQLADKKKGTSSKFVGEFKSFPH